VASIHSLLQQFPFLSYKVLCRKLKIGKATCLRPLHDNLHLEKFNLRDVPHSLEADQKRSRVEFSRKVLQILEQDQQYEFEYRLTGDDSWFFFEYFHHSCWAANPGHVTEIPNRKFNPKVPHFDYLRSHRDQKSVICSERHEI
jgi:hypothetical protein